MSRNAILLEDKRFSLSNIPKKVLKGTPDNYKSTAKSRIFEDYEDENEINLNENILKFVSDGLKFDREVVKNTCAHALKYNPEDVQQIFNNKTDLGNNVRILQKSELPKRLRKWPKESARANLQASIHDEIVYQPAKVNQFKLNDPFVTVSSLDEIYSKPLLAIENVPLVGVKSVDEMTEIGSKQNSVFLTETSLKEPFKLKKQLSDTNKEVLSKSLTNLSFLSGTQPKKSDWDDYLISKLSYNTARWIIAKKTDTKQKERLLSTLERMYGKSTIKDEDVQLYEDSISEYSDVTNNKSIKRSAWRKPSELLLSPANRVEINQNEIPLYRLPQGVRRQIKMQEKEMGFKYNRTAQSIKIEHKRALSARTFQELMKDKLDTTNTIFLTENNYQIEMTNGHNEHDFSEEKDQIKMKNNKKFSKTTQIVYPKQFTDWIHDGKAEPNALAKKRPTKGHKRWTELPKEINENEMNPPSISNEIGKLMWNFMMPTTPDVKLKKLVKTNTTVAYIVQEWRRRWQIGSRWACAEIDELIKDMKDIHANIRFQAVVVCSRAAEFANQEHNQEKQNIDLFKHDDLVSEYDEFFGSEDTFLGGDDEIQSKNDKTKKQSLKDSKTLPEKLFVAIECLLDDTNDKVRLAAAITIFTVERNKNAPKAKEKAESILRQTLDSHNLADRYAAAQCLAEDGIFEYKIIFILLQNYLTSNEQVTREQMTNMLSNLSRKTYLVNSMVGEYLNSDEVRNRILSCKLLPCLRRPLNKDLTAKLIHLMWNDNDKTVRKVAAQTLGRTGRGQNVHEELYLRLQSKQVNDRLEALRKIHYLGIMTAKLLTPYLKCFKDDYINVRELACTAAQKLQIRDENIISMLLELAQYDKIPKVKACAIETLGLVCTLRDDVKNCLLWALRYELDPMVRAEACHSLVLLANNEDAEVIDALQERYLIEDDPTVKAELNDALRVVGFDPGQDMPILTQIKKEVQKLNTRQIIWKKITTLEKQLEFEFNKKRFIYSEEVDELESRQASALSTSKDYSKPKSAKIKKANEKLKEKVSTENSVTNGQNKPEEIEGDKKEKRTKLPTTSNNDTAVTPTNSDSAKTDYLQSIETVSKENIKQSSEKHKKSQTQKLSKKDVNKLQTVEKLVDKPKPKSTTTSKADSNNTSFLSKLVDDTHSSDLISSSELDQQQQQQNNEDLNELDEDNQQQDGQKSVKAKQQTYQSNKDIDTIYEESQEILS